MLVNIHEAKTHLSRLVDRASSGEEIIIGKAGKPLARLVHYVERPQRRRAGLWRGKVRIGRAFDATPGEILDDFER